MIPEFNIGTIVYLKTDIDQNPYIVTGLLVRSDHIEYVISSGPIPEIYCQAVELSETKDYTK